MKVFLSWAGEQSKHVAQTLSTWLPQVIQALEPWFSPRISKGDAWDGAIADGLEQSPVGIIVLTPESLESKYLHYEAGAIANVKGAKACTLLIGLKPSDVKQPLGRFQHTKAEPNEVLDLLRTINEKVREAGEKALSDENLTKAFNLNWPELMAAINKDHSKENISKKRSVEDVMEEVLSLVRTGFGDLQNSILNPQFSNQFSIYRSNDLLADRAHPPLIEIAKRYFDDQNISEDYQKHKLDFGDYLQVKYPRVLYSPGLINRIFQKLEDSRR